MTKCKNFADKLFLIIVLSVINSSLGTIPDFIKVCKRDDAKINQCIRNSVEEIRSKLSSGIPELEVPPIEPMKIPKINLSRGPKSANVYAELYNIRVWGPSNFVIIDLKSDIPDNRFEFKLLLPKLYFEGKYIMNMRVLLLQMQGKGDVNGTFTNYTSDVIMKGNKIKRDYVDYLEFEPLNVKLNIGKAQLYFTNLFNGDPNLGALVNQIINDHSKTFIQEILPALENSISNIFTEAANKITSKFSYDELFL